MPESDIHHDSSQRTPEGWHNFQGLNYLEGLEDALQFVREENKKHEWVKTGVYVTTLPGFPEMKCKVCGAINWGNKNDGICLGNNHAEIGLIRAHNRRAGRIYKASMEKSRQEQEDNLKKQHDNAVSEMEVKSNAD